MKSHNRILAPVLAGLALAASANAAVIVAEGFGGLAANNLNSTPANTFSSAITTAGGSATWVAHESFKADGSITDRRKSAHLNLGSYINDAKGAANGIFVLQATLAQPTGPTDTQLASLGFATENSPDTFKSFNNQEVGGDTGSTNGLATVGYRISGTIDAWGGPSSTNVVNGPTGISGDRTLRITLDLSGHDNITNFGIARFAANTGIGGTFEEFGSYAYTENVQFGSILLSVLGTATSSVTVTTTYSDLTLTQIPEPAAALLGGLGMLILLRRRR